MQNHRTDRQNRANCNQTGHPASYKGCPFIKYAQKLTKDQTAYNTAAAQQKVTQIRSSFGAIRSYAQATRTTEHPQQPPYRNREPPIYTHPNYVQNIGNNNTDQTAHPPPLCLNDFKHEMATLVAALVSEQIKPLASQVATNTVKIEFLLSSIYTQ